MRDNSLDGDKKVESATPETAGKEENLSYIRRLIALLRAQGKMNENK